MFINLPNEIIRTVLEYLKPHEIIYSFSNLNQHLTSLIHCYQQNVDLRSLSNECIAQILPLIRNDVISLKINQFILTSVENGNLCQQFPSLQQLSISKINLHFSRQFLPFAQSFKQLTKLELKCSKDKKIVAISKLIDDECITPIFQNDSLIQECSIIPCSILSDATIAKLSPCRLTQLEIHLTAGRDLFVLFGFIPNIEVFKCRMSYFVSKEDILKAEKIAPTIPTPYLREFSLENTDYDVDFPTFASFLKDRQSIVELTLNLRWHNEPGSVDGHYLHQNLLQHLTNLKSFRFAFKIDFSGDAQLLDLTPYISTYQTDFWLKDHGWKVSIRTDIFYQFVVFISIYRSLHAPLGTSYMQLFLFFHYHMLSHTLHQF